MTEERTEPISLDLPVSIAATAKRCAERAGVSLDRFVSIALAEKIGAQDAAASFERRGAAGNPARAIAMLHGAPDVPPAEGDEIGS
ncbi:MAG: pilus assembly protein HicB [Pseudomonadota bacterium]